MMISEEEISKLEATKTPEEWDDLCDEIKAARDGEYPPDWFKKVMISGIATKARARWNENCQCGKEH